MGADEFTARYGDLLQGGYDCVDRIVLNAYNTLCHNPGGFRVWWRRLHGADEHLDNAHLMRMAGRFARGSGPRKCLGHHECAQLALGEGPAIVDRLPRLASPAT